MDTKRLRQRVLDLAIHGKLVPQNPQDEPASELLKRIAAEKERLVKEGKIKKSKKKDNEDIDEVPFEVPQGWVWSKLEDISNSIGDGLHGTPIFDENGDYFFVNGNNLNKKIIIKDDTKRTTYEEYQKQGLTFNKQTVFLSINGTLGNTAFYNEEKIVLGKSTCYINLCDNVSKYYIDNLLKSNYFAKYSVSSATGSTIKNIPLSAVRNFTLPLPPLAEQHRIVSDVEKYFSLIDILEESENDLQQSIQKAKSKILDLAIKGKLVEQDENDEPAYILLERIKEEKNQLIKEKKIKKEKALAEIKEEETPFEIPEKWIWCRLGDLAFYKKGPFGSSLTKAMFVPDSETAYKVYEQKNAIQKNNNLGDYYIDAEKFEELKGFEVNPQDIIVSCAGTIGETYVLPKTIRKGIINQALMIIRLHLPQIQDFYLYYFDFILKKTAATEGKGTAIKNIPPFEILKNYLFPLPPLAEQHRIVAKIEELFTQLDNIAEALK